MKQNRDIINKHLIPEISKRLGKSVMSYRLGGSFATSYNSSDVYNFDVKDEGDVEIADPERSYLTTTLYPISSRDAISSALADQMTGRFTDNLYANLGDAENYYRIGSNLLTGIFKVALIDYQILKTHKDYDENSLRIHAHTLTGILRDVLRLYNDPAKNTVMSKATKLTLSMRSVLIKYEYYKAESVLIQPTTLVVSSSITLDGAFESFIPFDAEQRIVEEEIPEHSEITDKASLTWSKTGSPIVQNSVSKEGDYSLYLNGSGSSIKSQESLEYTPSDSESLIIENWLKPDTITTSLLTRYGGVNNEKGLYYDYCQKTNWTGSNANSNTSSINYLFNNPTHYLENSNTTSLVFLPPSSNSNGQTLELNAQVSTTSTTLPLVLLSNKSSTYAQGPNGISYALVYYSPSYTVNPSLAGKVAIISDNTTNAPTGTMLASTSTFANNSILSIAVVSYGNYLRLFVNGKLESFSVLTQVVNFSTNGTYINKCGWIAAQNATFAYKLYALRFTGFALYTEDYKVSDVYSPRAIPKIKTLDKVTKYPEGIACGVRYSANTSDSVSDTTTVYASLSDGENVYIAESMSIDTSKWNNIKLSIFRNTLVLYVNGVSYSSEIIPYDIELETISLGSTTSTTSNSSFSGYIDNFKVYKDKTFDLEGVKYVELRPFLNNVNNTALEDFNPNIKWEVTTTPTIVSDSSATTILNKLINCSTNPKILTKSVTLDTQNFGIRLYFKAATQSATLIKIGLLEVTVADNVIKATTNGSVFIESAYTTNTVIKVDLRYNRGKLELFLNDVSTGEAIDTTLNVTGTLFYGWDGLTTLYTGLLGPLSIFDNNRNRIPAIDMVIDDFTEEAYYKNTVVSISARDNTYTSEDNLFFDNSYAPVLNDVIAYGSVTNSTMDNGIYIPYGSYLKINSNPNHIFGKEDFTIEYDVKTSVTSRRQVVVDRYASGAGSWQTSINTDGNLYFTVTTSGSYYFLTTTTQKINDGEWHKIFVRRTGVDLYIYVDNKLADRFVLDSIIDFNAARDLYVGYQGGNGNSSYNFEGYINNIRLTRGSITEEEEETETDPFAKPKEEIYNPTLLTASARTLRTFDTNLTGDSVAGVSWINNGTELSSANSLRSVGSLRIPYGTFQTTTGSNTISIDLENDFCIELSFFASNLSGTSSILSRAGSYNVTVNSTNLTFEVSNASGILESARIPYKFMPNFWYEVAICNKAGVIFVLINGLKYYPISAITSIKQVSDTVQTFIGKQDNHSPKYFDGFLDSLKVSYGTSVYTKNLGSDNAYLENSFNLTTLTGLDGSFIDTLKDLGTRETPVEINRIGTSTMIADSGFLSSGYFGVDSFIKDSTGRLGIYPKEFSMISKMYLLQSSAERALLTSTESATATTLRAFINADNQLVVELRLAGEVLKTVTSTIKLPVERWFTLGIVRTSQNVLRLYVNGVLSGTLNSVTEELGELGLPVYIGATSSSLIGYIDTFNIYRNKVVVPKVGTNLVHLSYDPTLTSPTSLTDFESPLIKYTTTALTTEYGIDGKYTPSAFFNGLGTQIVSYPHPMYNISVYDFDIEVEIFPTDGLNRYQTIISDGAQSPLRLWLYGSAYGGSGLNNRIAFGYDLDVPLIKSDSAIYFDKWTLIRLTRDSDKLRLYIDGVLETTVQLTNERFDTNKFIFGTDGSGLRDSYFKGYLSDVRISKGDIVKTINTDKYKVISALDFESSKTNLVIYDYDLNMERFDKFRHSWAVIKTAEQSSKPILKTITSSNEAVYLDSTNGFIYKNKNTHVSFKQFTIEMKFMLTANVHTTWRRLLDQTGLYAINITGDRRVEFNGGSLVLQSAVNTISSNKWYHVAVTRDTSGVTRLFLDGMKVGESSVKQNFSEVNHYPICLGMYYSYYTNSGYRSYNFEGFIDNFYMINGTCKYTEDFIPNIPSDTVLANTSLAYVVGSSFRDTNPSITWSFANMTVSTSRVFNKSAAMYSNSTSGYLQTSMSDSFKPGYKDFTIDFIISPLQILSPTTLFDTRSDVNLARGLVVTQATGNTGSFTLQVGSSTGTTDYDVTLNTGVNSIAANTYYHLRITRNLGKIYLFLNGVLKASADYVGDVPSSGSFILGNRLSKNQGFTGYIEQFRYLDKTSLAGTTFDQLKLELI